MLKQHLGLSAIHLEIGKSQYFISSSSTDVDRAISLLSEFNNAVFIVEDQKQAGNRLIAETVNKFSRDASGQIVRKGFQLDAKEFINASSGQIEIRLEEILGVLENEREKSLLVITSLEEFARNERLAKLLQKVVKASSFSILGITTIDGFRQLEKNPELAGCLQFILSEKSPRIHKRSESVLIIGATSLFGNAVYQLFSREYKFVRGTGFSKAGLLGFDKLDVMSEEEIKEYFAVHPAFDIIIYITGEADADVAEKERDRAKALNVDAVTIIARYAKNNKFVYISSEYVFDGSTWPYGSYSEARPINYYGRTKLEGEGVSLKNFPDALVLRLGALYGYNSPRDKKTSVSKIIASFDKNEVLKVDNIQIKHPILLEDAAKTLLKLLDYGATGIYQANGPEGLNKQEMAKQIVEVYSDVASRTFSSPIVGIEQPAAAAKPLNTHMVNVDTPRSFREGIRFMLLKQKTSSQKDNNGH
ncbi:MAG: sugar nucleotide-binding protein [Candidatus Omnitrophota bacterium]